MRRQQSTEETNVEAANWVRELRVYAAEGGTRLAPSDCDALATLVERLAEREDIDEHGRDPERMNPVALCDR